jgi:hypothetical protein
LSMISRWLLVEAVVKKSAGELNRATFELHPVLRPVTRSKAAPHQSLRLSDRNTSTSIAIPAYTRHSLAELKRVNLTVRLRTSVDLWVF